MPGGDPAMLAQLAAQLETAARGAATLAGSTSQVTADVRSATEWTGDAADSYTAFTKNLTTGGERDRGAVRADRRRGPGVRRLAADRPAESHRVRHGRPRPPRRPGTARVRWRRRNWPGRTRPPRSPCSRPPGTRSPPDLSKCTRRLLCPFCTPRECRSPTVSAPDVTHGERRLLACWPMGIPARFMLAQGRSPWRPQSEPTTSSDAVTDGGGEADMRRASNRLWHIPATRPTQIADVLSCSLVPWLDRIVVLLASRDGAQPQRDAKQCKEGEDHDVSPCLRETRPPWSLRVRATVLPSR